MNGPLSRLRTCCGHTSGSHVWRYADTNKSPTSLYCNTCREVCEGKPSGETRGSMLGATSSGSPWGILGSFVKPAGTGRNGDAAPAKAKKGRAGALDEIIADLERDGSGSRSRSAPVGVFDRLVGDLERDRSRLAAGVPAGFTRSQSCGEDPSEFVTVFEEDGRVVRHHVPRSRLERLADELLEAKRTALPTREEVREQLRRSEQARRERQHQRNLSEIRALAAHRREVSALVADIEASARRA